MADFSEICYCLLNNICVSIGIHLDAKQRSKVTQLNDKILATGSQFQKAILDTNIINVEELPERVRKRLVTFYNKVNPVPMEKINFCSSVHHNMTRAVEIKIKFFQIKLLIFLLSVLVEKMVTSI